MKKDCVDQYKQKETNEKLNEIFTEDLEETDQSGEDHKFSELQSHPLYSKVRDVSNTHDLMGLIYMGLPEDEYDPETEKILPLLNSCGNDVDLAIRVASVYNKMFYEKFKASDDSVINFSKGLFELKKQ